MRRAKKHSGLRIAEMLRGTRQHVGADVDMSEATPAQRMKDAIRMQRRLYGILR